MSDKVRVYRVEDCAESIGVGYVRAKSEREAVEKANNGEVRFDYEPGRSRLSAKWVRDPREAEYNDPGESAS